jgi:hypothetical protein
MDESDAFRL